MRVLVACEFSGTVRDAFIARGHDAWSCDLLPSEAPGNHYQCDVFDILGKNWELLIGHPPCPTLANSGVMWLHKQPGRWDDMRQAAGFFRLLLNCGIPKIAIENPIPHKYALEHIKTKYDQIIQPWQFGHAERKATCLWLKGLPHLVPVTDLEDEMNARPKREAQRIHYTPPGPDRWKIRSRTFKGIAEAMADQWGKIIPGTKTGFRCGEDPPN